MPLLCVSASDQHRRHAQPKLQRVSALRRWLKRGVAPCTPTSTSVPRQTLRLLPLAAFAALRSQWSPAASLSFVPPAVSSNPESLHADTTAQVSEEDLSSTVFQASPASFAGQAAAVSASSGRSRSRQSLAAGAGDVAATGYAIAALSSFFNGSFPAASKLSAAPLDPVLFNGIVCLGVFLSSIVLPLVSGTPYLFTLGGLLGGVLFVFAALFSFVAIPRCGLATAQAVWSTSAILVAFCWGAFGPKEVAAPLGDFGGSIGAVVLLLLGAAIAVSSDTIAAAVTGEKADAGDASDDKPAEDQRVSGIVSALAVGLFGGSVLVPFKFVPPEAAGLAAIPSFGLGSLLAGVIVTAVYWFGIKKESSAPVIPGDAIVAALTSGLVWNLGNICSIIAQSPPYLLPYGIAYPILQCALFFGGLWGIFVFNEIRGASIPVFFSGATILAGGIVLLSQYGPGAGG